MKKVLSCSAMLLLGVFMIAGCGGTADLASKDSVEKNLNSDSSSSVKQKQETANTHEHSPGSNEKAAAGLFEETEVQDRELSDWRGSWQSVYPYLKSGELDKVLQKKAEEDEEKNIEDFRAYYETGYQTNIEKIDIYQEMISFYQNDGWISGNYSYSGYKILTYASGKKGVRYLFDKTDGDDEAPQSVQFSDHIIAPEKSAHYHIYLGNQSQEELLQELDNWPTYYPAGMTGEAVADEMYFH